MTAGSAALATLCAVLWGGLAVAISFTQEDLPPFGTAAIRFGCATLVLILWARYRHSPLTLSAGQFGPCATLGLLLFVQIGTFHWGLNRTNSAHASVLIGANPVFVALLAHLFLPGDRLTAAKSLGLILAMAGLIAVVSGDERMTTEVATEQVTLLGDLVILGSSAILGLKMIYTKRVLPVVEVTKLIVWSNALGALLLFVYSALFEGFDQYHFTGQALWGLAYQGFVVAGFCFLAWAALLRWHRASQLAVFGFFQPLFGIIFGVWLRNDPLSVWLAAGGMAVGLGIWLVNRSNA